ncbi:MAG: ABC transporter permease [Thermoanaerobaculia bacterium]|nr:ABC transporter permease [Thermoanaerobaculia bacterium]
MLLVLVLTLSSLCLAAVAGLHRGLAAQTTRLIESVGSDCYRVSSQSRWSRSQSGVRISDDSLDLEDLRALEIELGDRFRFAPYTGGQAVDLALGDRRIEADLLGIGNEYLALRAWRLEHGNSFRESESEAQELVVILGASVARELGGEGLIGQIIRVADAPFRVTGVLAAKGAGVLGEDQDRRVFVPLDVAAKRVFSSSGLRGFLAVPRDTLSSESVTELLTRGLERRGHHLSGPNQDAYLTGPDWLRARYRGSFSAVLRAGEILLLCVGLIAAVVVCAGFYFAVAERSTEIGLKRALGGTRLAIASEVLLESAILGCLGTVLGSGLAWVGSRIVSSTSEIAPGFSRYPIAVTPGVALLVGGGTLLLALTAALPPAWRAASSRPADSLRSE